MFLAFETVGHLNKHRSYHSKLSTYKCKMCNKIFHDNNLFKEHTRCHEDEDIFQFLKCETTLESLTDDTEQLDTRNTNFHEIELSSNAATFHQSIENVQQDKE